ncbi:MAG TPA: efflux RND transporter periplasmic adaptor subunit [Caulobacteraceae bacterium]
MSTSIRVGLILAICTLLAACGGKDEQAAKPALTVSVAAVKTEPLARTVEASGTVEAWELVPVGAETGGLTATAVYVDEGSVVRQGQVLVKLNDAVLRSQLRQQDASVAAAKAQLAQADAALGRARELKAKGFLSQAALDARLAEQQTAAAQVAAAQAARAETATRLSQTEVRAPVGGLIASRSVVKGQIVAAGSELLTLVRDGRLELNAQVPEQDINRVRPGMPATVTGDEVTTAGKVRIVTPRVDPQTRVGLARVSIVPGSKLKPGMFARAIIQTGAHPALTVPQTAIIFRDDKAGVYVLDARKHVQFRTVATGARAGPRVEITAGLREGERVVVQGAGFLADGDLVRVAG